jgi:zinc D-Ala-D-Ala carboxypeptidase
MQPLYRKTILLLVCLALMPGPAVCAPEWTYPLEPTVLANTRGYLTLVNTEHLLDAGYEPSDLTSVTVKSVSRFEMRKDANDALRAMFASALSDGLTLYVKSGYRDYATQKTMYYNRMDHIGSDDGVVAYPGSSDHQTGLGVDVLNYAWTKKDGMTTDFGLTPEAQWMAAHCAEYGFIIRYMDGKQAITGIMYEPWHLRYVGPEAAAYIMSHGLSLEEFTAQWQQAVQTFETAGISLREYVRQLFAPRQPVLLGVPDDTGDSDVSLFYPAQ